MLDVDRLRADTPGVDRVIHLNNAGASLMPRPVVTAMTSYLEREVYQGGYETAASSQEMVANAYDGIAAVIGGEASEIAMLESSTIAWDRIIYSLPHTKGDRLLTTTTEYGSNWAAYLQLQDRFGVEVVVVPDASTGEIDLDALSNSIDGRTTLISLNHVPTNGGVVNPAADVGTIAKQAGVPFLLDACQSVGQMPIDVDEIGCTYLTTTSRKFLRGPRGLGVAWVATAVLEDLTPIFADNHSTRVTDTTYAFRPDARRLESWERSYVTLAGFEAAVAYARDIGIDDIWERIRHLSNYMRTGLKETEGIRVLDRGTVQGGIVSFTVDGRSAVEVKELLHERGINVSWSTVNSSPYDMRMRDLDELVRASVHAYNTEEEVETFLSAVAILAG